MMTAYVPITYRTLTHVNRDLLERIAPDVFDAAPDPRWTSEFLDDPRHHMIVAIDERPTGGLVVGMVSALSYVHPDKATQLFVTEIGVATTHRRRGIGLTLLRKMLEHGRALGCASAWVATEADNEPARRLYERAGAKGEDVVMYPLDLTEPDA